jgi:8-oxo-dGTP diphosphatase
MKKMICKTYNIGELTNYKYVIILSIYHDQLLLSKHKERTTWETQGGHIEAGETPLEAAKRELYEESGAIQYEIAPFCDYWAGHPDEIHGAGGVVFIAHIATLGNIPESEMQEVKTFSELPDNITYPGITPVLYEKLLQLGNEVKDFESVELWDAYLTDGTLEGRTLIRDQVIPEGLYHIVAEVFVIHTDGTILLMRRDEKKESNPGLWESGAGGSILKGENPTLGARRELLEETGILADEIKPIYTVHKGDSIYMGYLCITNAAKESVTLQKGETIDFKWVEKEAFIKIMDSEEFVASRKDRLKGINYDEKDSCSR